MLRNRTFQRSLSRLAFIAVLLMAFAPVASRWARGDALQQLMPGLSAVCTAAGLQSVDVAAWLGDGSASISSGTSKVPAPDDSGMGADCAYCTLLAGTALLLLAIALLLPPLPASLVPGSLPLPFRSASLFPGLGSRGPPLAL